MGIKEASTAIARLAPGGAPVRYNEPLVADESVWFLRAVDAGLVRFRECPQDCFRYRKWGARGPDHFDTPTRKPRHLFSRPGAEVAWLNREYVPHIAAYGRAILDYGYDRTRSSFSLYRVFSRDLLAKRAGQSYETDAEFYATDGSIWLQVEAKADPRQTDRLAEQVASIGELRALPVGSAKELEYVLDLAPAFLWIVGPGSVDPPSHVFAVHVSGLDAGFQPRDDLPPPPS